MENTELSMVEARRGFLKKMAYVAPAVVALGALNAQASVTTAASVFNGKTYVNPGERLVGESTVTGLSGPDVIHGGTYQQVYSDGTKGAVVTYTGAEVQQNNYGFFSWAKTFFGNILG